MVFYDEFLQLFFKKLLSLILFFNRKSYKSCLLSFLLSFISCISFQFSGSIEVKEKVQLLQTSVKNGTNGNTNGNMGYQVSKTQFARTPYIVQLLFLNSKVKVIACTGAPY